MINKSNAVAVLVNDYCFYNDIAGKDVAGHANTYGTYVPLSEAIADRVLESGIDIEAVVILCLGNVGLLSDIDKQTVMYLVERINQIIENVEEL